MAEPINDPSRSAIVSAAEFRAASGVTAAKDISDADLEAIIKRAQVDTINRIAKWSQGLELIGPKGANNTIYLLPGTWRMVWDQNLSKTVTGADLRVYKEDGDDPPTITDLNPASVDGRHGRITLTTAVAGDERVFLDGYLVRRVIEWESLREAIICLTGYRVDRRARDPNRVALAHPNMKKSSSGGGRPSRQWLDDWKRVTKRLRGPVGENASIDTELSAKSHRGII